MAKGEGRRRSVLRAGLICALFVFTAAAGPAAAEVYYHQDGDGVFHFSNTPRAGSRLFDLDAEEEPVRSAAGVSAPVHRPTPAEAASHAAYDDLIRRVASEFDVDPALVKAIIRTESGFDKQAISPRGARGLMQLMPYTAKNHGVQNAHDPQQNVRGGVRHFRKLLDRYDGSVSLALAAYNAGEAYVDRHRRVPPILETRGFVARVLKYRTIYSRDEQLAAN